MRGGHIGLANFSISVGLLEIFASQWHSGQFGLLKSLLVAVMDVQSDGPHVLTPSLTERAYSHAGSLPRNVVEIWRLRQPLHVSFCGRLFECSLLHRCAYLNDLRRTARRLPL